jgi:O-acetyl-ADP-ribose deacetylase (regulator of RNase III)
MHCKFPNRIPDIQQCIRGETKTIPSKDVEKERGYFQESYGVGKCIFLYNPLSSTHRIVLAAVTSKRAGMGLRSEVSNIFQAVSEIYKIMVDKGIRKIYSPLMGAGHGCLSKEVSLFSLVLAWSEILCNPLGPRIDVNIVVFKADDRAEAELSSRITKRILKVATGMFKN